MQEQSNYQEQWLLKDITSLVYTFSANRDGVFQLQLLESESKGDSSPVK
jgi:hypothetical protein